MAAPVRLQVLADRVRAGLPLSEAEAAVVAATLEHAPSLPAEFRTEQRKALRAYMVNWHPKAPSTNALASRVDRDLDDYADAWLRDGGKIAPPDEASDRERDLWVIHSYGPRPSPRTLYRIAGEIVCQSPFRGKRRP